MARAGRKPLRFARLFAVAALLTPVVASAQSVCYLLASTPQIRAEGVTERVGDILLQCTFGNPGGTLSTSLTVYLTTSVTNRVDESGLASDALLSADSGSGFVSTGINGKVQGASIAFYGVNLTIPATGQMALKISGIRAAASQLGTAAVMPITASISSTLPLAQSQITVAYTRRSLYDTLYSTGITCLGSAVPATVTMTNLFATGTAFASTRLTEAMAGAFQPRASGDDNGTRFLVKYSGFPDGAQAFLPDFVAGSDALVPTSGGDLGTAQAVGQYLPGSGTLLLARVPLADSTGAGGVAMSVSGSGAVLLDSVSAVSLTKGAGYAVYEVVDGNLSLTESAQFPTFVGLSTVTGATVQESVSYAAVSSTPLASQTAAMPRFASTTPTSDCSIVGDCDAGYFPVLHVTGSTSLQSTVTAGDASSQIAGSINVTNTGGGTLNWTITINYQNGSGWLALDETWGLNSGAARAWVQPQNLTAGTYKANLVVNGGGPQSTAVTIPVTVTVQAASSTSTPVSTTPPTVTSVVNPATLTASALVAGSLAAVIGTNLNGSSVSATFDGVAATVVSQSSTQLTVQVPASLDATKTSSTLVVTVDGMSSAGTAVALAPAGPAIFSGGVLNQDSTVNAPKAAAAAASVLQIYATGIPASATVSVLLGGQGVAPLYAGAAPGLTGVQQVNATVPSGLASGANALSVCAVMSSQVYCSPGVTVYVK